MVKRSAIAFALDVADDTASHGVASARADPTRYSWMIERLRIVGRRGGQREYASSHPMAQSAGRLNGQTPPTQNAPATAKSHKAQAAQARTRRAQSLKEATARSHVMPSASLRCCRMGIPPPCAACACSTSGTRLTHTRAASRACSKRHSCKNPSRTICATCPGAHPPPMISSWVYWRKATELPRARQGFWLLSNAAPSSWRWFSLGKA